MNIKLVILLVIIVISSVSIVVASDLDDYGFDNNTKNDSLTPEHHSLHHTHYDENNAKNDFTIDGYLLKFTQNQ